MARLPLLPPFPARIYPEAAMIHLHLVPDQVIRQRTPPRLDMASLPVCVGISPLAPCHPLRASSDPAVQIPRSPARAFLTAGYSHVGGLPTLFPIDKRSRTSFKFSWTICQVLTCWRALKNRCLRCHCNHLNAPWRLARRGKGAMFRLQNVGMETLLLLTYQRGTP